MNERPFKNLPWPLPPGLMASGAPPGFVPQPTEILSEDSDPNLTGNSEDEAPTVELPRNDIGAENNDVPKLPKGPRKIYMGSLGVTVVNCSDLEEALLARGPERVRQLIKRLDELEIKKNTNPPPPSIPLLQQQRLVSPQQHMRHQHCPPGVFQTNTGLRERPQIPGLFYGVPVENRIHMAAPPPPGFEGSNVRAVVNQIHPFPGFPIEAQQSPQPWSPSRQAAGPADFDAMPEKLREIFNSVEQQKYLNDPQKVEEELDIEVIRQQRMEEKMRRKAIRKREKRAAKLKALRELKQANREDTSSSNSGTKTNEAETSKGTIEVKGNNGQSENDTQKEVPKKKKQRKRDKVKKENKLENGNSAPCAKKEFLRKCDELKPGIFSKILLKEAEEDVEDLESGLIDISLQDEGCETQNEKDKSRKLKKSRKRKERFEPYITLDELEKGLADNTLFENELRINPKNYTEAYISDPDNGQDIIILGLVDRNRALEGDIVVVKLKDEADWHKSQSGTAFRTGKVVFVTERVHHCATVGTLHFCSKGLFMLKPRDQRFPLLRIPSTSIPPEILSNLKEENEKEPSDVLYRAILLSWNNPRFANGIIQDVVGKKGDMESETTAIFLELGLNKNPIPEALNRHLPPLPYIITQEEIESRLDLRSEVIFSIDPPTARDLDDAVSIKKLTDNTFEVGVHISDVTHFLKEGTPLDVEVSERATTVYMVEKAYHMLPIALCGLCSLLPGEDKLAVSVIFKLDEEGNVLDKKFSRTVINSCAQLSYDHAQAIIEGKDVELPVIYNDVSPSTIKEAILLLNKIAIHRRKRRFDTGALRIDQPKVCFDLSSDCSPQGMFIYEIKDSHRLIEEFMLLANEYVARYIHSKFPDVALLRRHDPPKSDMMVRLENSLQKLGIIIDSSCAGTFHKSLTKYSDADPLIASVLTQLCTKPMQRAEYFCSSNMTHHYALNLDKYTHFTSPIRRYADVVVHRVLMACLGYTPLPPWSKHDVKKFAATSNRKKLAAKKAGDMSSNLFRTYYIKEIGGMTVEAFIVGVNSRSIDVTIPSIAHNMRVYLEKLENVKCEFHENDICSRLMVEWPGAEEIQVLQIFSAVKLRLSVSEKMPTTIEAELLPPGS